MLHGVGMDDAQYALAQHIIDGLHLEDIAPEDIDPQAPLFGEGLGLDSIDALELAILIQRKYGCRIADAETGKRAFASLDALYSFIQRTRS
jgi:acyl carrier protein